MFVAKNVNQFEDNFEKKVAIFASKITVIEKRNRKKLFSMTTLVNVMLAFFGKLLIS